MPSQTLAATAEPAEVYLGGVPSDIVDNGLKKHLTPFMEDLKIKDWCCETPRGRRYGFVTFLRPKDAELFLRVHGEIDVPGISRNGKPRKRARLSVLGTFVYCTTSKRHPNPFMAKSLMLAAEKRMKEPPPPPDREPNVTMGLSAFSVGHYSYSHPGHLTFVGDLTIQNLNFGSVKFARHLIIIELNEDGVRVEIDYRVVYEVIVGSNPTSITLTLYEPPKVFSVQTPAQMLAGLNLDQTTQQMDAKVRMDHFPMWSDRHTNISGQSLVYHLETAPENFERNLALLRQKDVMIVTYHSLAIDRVPKMNQEMDAFRKFVDRITPRLPISVLFQLQALVQNGYLVPQTVVQMIEKFVNLKRSNGIGGTKQRLPISAEAVKILFSQLPFPGPDQPASLFGVDQIWSLLERNERKIRQGLAGEVLSDKARQNLVRVFKAQVTPTRITLQGPEPEAKNRILRKFSDYTEYFLRVQFCDEDGQDLFFNNKTSLDRIWDRFSNILTNGISVAGRLYHFLGFSHSSLRSHAAWFMAPFADKQGNFWTYFNVISDLGKFNNIRSPARCAARIGQAFSETPFAISLKDLGVEVQEIDDVKSRDGHRIFSDGVGTISRDLMEAIHEVIPHKQQPTCFQIRFGGAKGMVALDDTLPGMVMRIRPESMVKFESKDLENLEICDTAKPIPLVLNRQMIKILEDMGVESWFSKLQDREVDRLRRITSSVDNTVIYLQRQKIGEHVRFPQLIRRLNKLGIDYTADRFLCSVVEAVVLRDLRLLKHKARIPVDKGVTLYGIMDEYGYLEEDEVFITFDRADGVDSANLDGRRIILTRSPALHPGDIQIRTAVVPPLGHPLRSLSNCIVFSQRGDRDLPSQLSGGDLDGDIFNAIWDDKAVSACKKSFSPADYPRAQPLDIGREVHRKDMTDFFVKFMATDQLGAIAVKHMILADQKSAGTADLDCLKLAELHSIGVDYSKTGIPVDMRELKGLGDSRYRPDFLSPAPITNLKNRSEIEYEDPKAEVTNDDEDDDTGPKHRYYKSDKVLGKLYRAIDEKKIWADDIRIRRRRQDTTVWDRLNLYVMEQCDELGGVLWHSTMEEAQGIRQVYEDAIWNAASVFSESLSNPISEVEVFTGNIFNKTGVQTRRQRDTSIRLKDEFDRISKFIMAVIRRQTNKAPVELHDDYDDYDDNDTHAEEEVRKYKGDSGASALELSVACLQVSMQTSEKRKGGSGRDDVEFHSFKVLAAACVLSELDMATKRRDIEAGAEIMSGGFVGVRGH